MQSNAVNTMLLIPKTLNVKKPETAKGLLSRNDTFMNMLKERITYRKDNSFEGRTTAERSNLQKNYVLKDNAKPVNDIEPEAKTKKLTNEPKDITKTSKPEAKGEPEVEGIENTSDRKEKIKEQIDSLEALIALLEELMARLDIKNVSADPTTSDTSKEPVLLPESKGISPMELLMALVKEDTVKLKKMMNELSDDMQTPEINDLMGKIQDLVEKLTKDQNMTELKAEIVGEGASKEELVEQLKSQCGQLIDKLKEQVSRLNAELDKVLDSELQTDSVTNGIEPEETVLSESVVAEPETRHETKDAKDGSVAFDEDDDASNVKAGAEIDNPFENIIIQNQQMPKEDLSQPASLEKTQLPLSEKPLTNTVTNQVVMKVKLMAGENKQEMEMHLKPDSLGKLSLKIIHERGEILAKITAENEQVKGILESNMQMLKDALEKSGYNVQSLSVEVGNSNGNSQNKENGDGNGRTQSAGFGRITSTSIQADADKLNLRARIEREYFNDTSKINLTA